MKKIAYLLVLASLIYSQEYSCLATMGKAGRPEEFDPYKEHIPHKSGIYSIKNKNNTIKYVGQSKDIKRRVDEHIRSGKVKKGDKIAAQFAHGNAKKPALDRAESKKIKKNKPPLNKVQGTPGRPWGPK